MYGILKKIGDATLVDKSINDLYPGEYHGVIKLPNGKYTWAQYMGPGSRIDLRIPKGQEGLTPIDKESLAHDIRYNLSATPEAIRAADNKFNEVIDRLRKEGKEDEFNLKQAELIKVKVFLEGNEILRKYIRNFNTRKTDIESTPELTKMFEDKLRKLEQQGYGMCGKPMDECMCGSGDFHTMPDGTIMPGKMHGGHGALEDFMKKNPDYKGPTLEDSGRRYLDDMNRIKKYYGYGEGEDRLYNYQLPKAKCKF